jgi:copper chaperone CopZ
MVSYRGAPHCSLLTLAVHCTVHCATAGGKGDAPVEHTLAVPTMTSAAAAGRIESALLSLPGVAGVSTSLVTSRVKVLVLASNLVSGSATAATSVGVRALLECVQGLGFEATVEKRASDVAMMGASQVRSNTVQSVIYCICVVCLYAQQDAQQQLLCKLSACI